MKILTAAASFAAAVLLQGTFFACGILEIDSAEQGGSVSRLDCILLVRGCFKPSCANF
ncbi:MAG: hypothetical protein JXR73_04815 [Candidatus Omnitrophica bacterium]|nr:hypothetical protein [Candidatus Omnitrophota bacterium]